ncbi:DNA repair photolyase [Amycolatopsis pretoriensis]|uniref:DNA repair photolyase n=1 Tax=Amycolatopsis pretoriensis TaxID=218821 RepID=A0A1H5RDF6_9PSEU|nr:radical SAM protein [Amycolatopsis pretoriensis]SEF35537.1 DNA repair photolyase [Amycolatopsis pretoriensis]
MNEDVLRWSGQRTDRVDEGTLPGLARLTGFVRSVRTPEFRGVTFHEVLAKSALNHVPADARMLPGEYTINPYRGCTHACQYCFARPTHTRLGLNVAGDFDNEVIVKTNIVEVLRNELARKRKLPPRVAFGTNTDVYQRAEGRYELMPGIIGALSGHRVPFSILTKGPLIRRDLPLLVRASQATTVHLGVSLSMLDEELQQSVEFGTATTSARLATVRAIRDAGLACTVFLSPILPHLSDSVAQLESLVSAAADAGATDVLYHPLYLSSGVKDVFFAWLRQAYPSLVGEYTRLYASGSETGYRHEIGARIRPLIAKYGFPEPGKEIEDKFALNGRRGQPPAPEPAQATLF